MVFRKKKYQTLATYIIVLMASEHFIPSKFVFSADYAPVVKNLPMLAALAEACLWPVLLLLFDDQFVPRLSNLYRRRSVSDRAKPPQGLHGKFRPYNGSLQDARRPPPPSSGGEAVRFPITNGSLFASLDGRVPVLHNYRRGSR
ncbi:lateral signaling target protein 2 [Aphis craccivora]|uniref:Lateral signaling target protein 2 n=1 Tax=Aphis craccivora TaxID=307492 RepID=A0A6G0YVY1_APHCR|nr:lateral signaling target protein 2 [Aphis craccivora]